MRTPTGLTCQQKSIISSKWKCYIEGFLVIPSPVSPVLSELGPARLPRSLRFPGPIFNFLPYQNHMRNSTRRNLYGSLRVLSAGLAGRMCGVDLTAAKLIASCLKSGQLCARVKFNSILRCFISKSKPKYSTKEKTKQFDEGCRNYSLLNSPYLRRTSCNFIAQLSLNLGRALLFHTT